MSELVPDYLARSQSILEAAGFEVLPLTRPIRGAWDLLGTTPQGHVLVALVRPDWPDMTGVLRYRRPDSFPPGTLCVLHRWTPGTEAALPDTRIVG